MVKDKGKNQIKVECPDCHQMFGKSGLGPHRASKHGVRGQGANKKVLAQMKQAARMEKVFPPKRGAGPVEEPAKEAVAENTPVF